MERVIPWSAMMEAIAPFYMEKQFGRYYYMRDDLHLTHAVELKKEDLPAIEKRVKKNIEELKKEEFPKIQSQSSFIFSYASRRTFSGLVSSIIT